MTRKERDGGWKKAEAISGYGKQVDVRMVVEEGGGRGCRETTAWEG